MLTTDLWWRMATALRAGLTNTTAVLRDMIMERQRLLIREANYLRGLVGLPPVNANKQKTALAKSEAEGYPAKQRRGSGSGSAREDSGNER